MSRFDDTRSMASTRTAGGTKVTRYIIKEDDSDRRTSHYDEGRRSTAGTRYDDRRTEIDVRREEDRSYSRAYSRPEPEIRRETITIRRDESPSRRDEYWRRPAGEDVEERELVIRRSTEKDNTERALSRIDDRRDEVVVSRQDDRRDTRYTDYGAVSQHRGSFDERDREVSRYIRTSEYYQPQQPQTIIIRQEPIIIRERARSRDYERDRSRSSSHSGSRTANLAIVKKSDVESERAVSRRSRSEPRDEEYFYEKRVRERIPSEDRYDRKMRRPVSPGDSISQVGRRSRGYESDDSMVYVRKEKREYSSDDEPNRKRELAAGALAGVGAAELIRNHNRKEGKETSSGGGRIAKDVGAGVVGAVAAEALRRYRSKSRNRSGSRDRGRRGSGERSRSRSGSRSNLKSFGGLGLAAAAVAAGALIASRNKKNASPDRRSRSRTRRSSRSRSRASSRGSALSDLENDPNATDDRNPKTRNKKTAAAGAVGAAAMALYERHRSKSRGRGSSGSPNRLKQGAPIVAGGLAAAGLAHLYEKRKSKEEAEDILRKEERRSRSQSGRSRSRTRTDSTYYDGPSQRGLSDPNLIQYGTEPLYGNNYGEGYYGRPSTEQDFYNNNPTRDIVPANAPPPAASSFDAASRRPTSAGRTRSISSSRSRSRSRGAAAAAGAVGAGVAASELDKNRKEKKERRRRSRQKSRDDSYTPTPDDRSRQYSYAPYTAGRDPYEDANWHATHSQSYAQGMHDPYASQTGFGQFPPPPGAMPQHAYAPPPAAGAPSYGPQDFPPPPPGVPQAQQPQFDPYAPNQNPYAPRNRGADENVSAAFSPAPTDQHHSTTKGLNAKELAMSPPIIGPNVTVQRPSVSTPVNQPRNKFPGNASNPFVQPSHLDGADRTGNSSGDASPGARPGDTSRSPAPSTSRAAHAYTPTPPPASYQPNVRSPSNQNTPQPYFSQQNGDIPVVTDSPSPGPNKNRNVMPEDPRVTAFRQAAYNAPTPQPPAQTHPRSDPGEAITSSPAPSQNRSAQAQDHRVNAMRNAAFAAPSPSPNPESLLRDQAPTPQPPQPPPAQPEMQQTSRRSIVPPYMPEPDIRPPSDESFRTPTPDQRMAFIKQNDSAPSMPTMIIPERSNQRMSPSPLATEQQQPARRERERSQSLPRSEPVLSAEPESMSGRESPISHLSHRKSVSFAAKPEYSEAPPPISRHQDGTVSDSDAEGREGSWRRRSERERDRDHHRRGNDRDRHAYDAGDDFSDDTPNDDRRRRGHDRDRDRDRDRGSRHSSRRERSNTQSLDRENGSSHDHDRDPKRSNTTSSSSSSRRHRDKDRELSPTGSDDTVDLPERFDDKGRRKHGSYGDGSRSPEQDIIADSLDQILGGLFSSSKHSKKR